MKHFVQILVAFLMANFILLDATGQTTVSLNPEQDNTMFQVPNRYSNGIGPEIYSGVVNNGSKLSRRSLIQFSFEDIPVDATITDVQLELYCTKVSSTGNQSNYDLHRLEESWGEESSYSNNGQGVLADTGDATWKSRFYDFTNPVDWQVQGGTFDPIPNASIPVNVKEEYYTWTSEQLIEDVQSMLDNPNENFGWMLKASEETIDGLGRAFASREHEDIEKRPRLVVTYDIPTSVNELNEKHTFHIYPNPGKNIINIDAINSETDQNYQIININGRIIKEGEITGPNMLINTITLQAGHYFIKFPNSGSKTITWLKY